MAELLYLVHRLPWPPDKGDKVRSYHLLRHLAARHRVHLGTFVDDPADMQHLEAVRAVCASVYAAPLHPRRARIASLKGLLTGQPLTLAYYRNAGLERWVQGLVQAGRIDSTVVFSSSMVPFAPERLPLLVDFVDVDSAKWAEYAGRRPWPLSWLYRREGERLLAYERRAAARAQRSVFAAEREAALFERLAPEVADRVQAISNGVDTAFFDPGVQRPTPYAAGELPLVFTGAMDYWPNIEAVCWFAAEMLPALRERYPQLRFHIVGRNPSAAVQALAGPAVHVTGTVPDVRPWLQHAAAVVAPLRLARGIQNKVLEAMAMARPVVTSSACAMGIEAHDGTELRVADTPVEYVARLAEWLSAPERGHAVGRAARERVQASYGWQARLRAFDPHLARLGLRGGAAASPTGTLTETPTAVL